jgi:hypothetical protein
MILGKLIRFLGGLRTMTALAVVGATMCSNGPAVGQAKPATTTLGNLPARLAGTPYVPPANTWQMSTPFNRILKPLIAKHPSMQSAMAGVGKVSGHALPSASAAGSAMLNFPGFFAAPYVSTSQLADATPLFASVTGDFNHDGKPDIATINTDGTVNVLLNEGKSNPLQNGISYSDSSALALAPGIAYAVAADMNGDGYTDIVGMDANNSALVLWINNGQGGFLPAVSVPVTPQIGASFLEGGAIAIGDVNGDGALDVVAMSIGQFSSSFSAFPRTNVATQVFLGDGQGHLEAPTEVDSNFSGAFTIPFGQSMQLADMNGDGTLDLVVNLETEDPQIGNFVFVSLNTAGTFAPINFGVNESKLPGFSNDGEGDLVVADLNGDGIPDVLWNPGSANNVSGILVAAYGDGTGNLSLEATVALNNIDGLELFALADINGDGAPDIVTYNDGSVATFLNSGGGTFSTFPVNVYTSSDGGGDQQPIVMDYNGDGKPDVVYVDSILNVASFYAGNGDGTFQAADAAVPAMVNPGDIAIASVGDINGDGMSDLIAADETTLLAGSSSFPNLVSLLSNSKGGFNEVTAVSASVLSNLPLGLQGDLSVYPMSLVDLNGDGRADFFFFEGNAIYTALSNGDGTFQSPVAISGLTLQCPPGLPDAGNIDGSGHTSIVFAYPGDASCGSSGSVPPSVLVLLNDGHANFTASVEPFGSEPFQAKLADLNGDGYPDLVLSDNNPGANVFTLYTAPNFGTAAAAAGSTFNFSQAQTVISNYAISDILVNDYNGDGIPDLALATIGQMDNGNPLFGTEGVLLLPGQGGFSFGPPNEVAQGTIPSAVRWADINQDGIPDLVIASDLPEVSGAPVFGMSVLPGLGKGSFAAPVSQVFPDSDSFIAIGDFNRDGAPDVAIAGFNQNNGVPFAGVYLNRGGDSLALSVSSASVGQGSGITLTATLKTTFTNVTPTGTVTFTSNGVVLGNAALNQGTAALNYTVSTTSAAGAYPVVATYSGDGNFNQATATASYSVAVVAPAISTTADTLTVNLNKGASAVVTLTVAANATYSGSVSLSATASSLGLGVVVNPAVVTLGAGQTQQISVVIGSGVVTSAALGRGDGLWSGVAGAFSLAVLFPLLAGRSRRLRSRLLLALLLCSSLGCFAGLTGCSGGGSSNASVAPGAYTVTITATPSLSGVAAQTTSVTVNVQ